MKKAKKESVDTLERKVIKVKQVQPVLAVLLARRGPVVLLVPQDLLGPRVRKAIRATRAIWARLARPVSRDLEESVGCLV